MSESDKKVPEKRSGQVRHDAGGRAVWQWAVESGKHAIESTSRLLKKLDITGLDVVDYDELKKRETEAAEKEKEKGKPAEQPVPTFGGKREVDPLAGSQRGFNPYDSRTPTKPVAAKPPARPPAKPRITQPAKPEKKPGLLGRLFGK